MSKSKIEQERDFIDGLLSLDTKADDYEASVRARCLGIISAISRMPGLLDERVALSTKRSEITRVRNVIRERLGAKHLALKYLRLKDSDQAQVHADTRKATVAKHYERRPLDVPRHVAIARTILLMATGDQASPLEIAAAVIAVTGRRPIEVLQDRRPLENGFDFAPVKKPDAALFDPNIGAAYRWALLFSGQRKEREAEKPPYQIPVLVEPELILTAIASIRKRYSCVGLTSTQVQDRAGKNLGRYVKGAEFGGFPGQLGPGYRDRDGEPMNPKDLRAAYAAAAYELYAPAKLSWNAYTSRILGHGADDLLTSFSYDVFFPWGSKRPYQDEVTIAARETFAALAKKHKSETNEAIRAKIAAEIATVKARFGEE